MAKKKPRPPKPKKRSRGRPSKFTPEIRAKILDAISAGNYREVAAEYAGVGKRTFYTWMHDKGRECEDFQQSVTQAENQAEIRMVALVAVAAKKDAKHAQWWLERKFHDRWGRKDHVETRNIDKDGNDMPLFGVLRAPPDMTTAEYERQRSDRANAQAGV
ncbi:MAG: hypothetical protein Q8N51_00815 [Gammaproteobacteria bacterium]|nr:hypothetical protein [Gammaproteobacteria bacterium]